MMIVRCLDNLPEVGGGYIALVGVRTLRHMTTMDMVNALKTVGIDYKEVNNVGFYAILDAFSIPRTALTTGADYSRR